MTLQEKMNRMNLEEIKGMADSVLVSLEFPMLAADQKATLQESWVTIMAEINQRQSKVCTVRKMSTSSNPADDGEQLKRFIGKDGWDKAVAYRDALYNEAGIESYVSVKQL